MSNPSARPAFTPERARRLGQRGIVLLGSLALLGGALAVGRPAPAQANTAQANTAQALVSTSTAATVPPGANLLANPHATVGDTSAQGWDAVTIPGWQIGSGLPTVVRYGTPGFPKAAKPPKDPGNLFVGGAGGTATLVQNAPVIPARPSAGAVTYTISAWLGGTKTSAATLTVRFRNTGGAVVATRAIGPVGRRQRPLLQRRTATGTLPKGAATAQVTLSLATTLTNVNGPNAPLVGYDYAAAGGLDLSLSAPRSRPPRSPRRPRACPATSTSSCSTSRTRTTATSSATSNRPRTSTASGSTAPADGLLRRGAPERRQLPRLRRRRDLRRPARPTPKRKTRSTPSTRPTSATSSTPRTKPGRRTRRAPTARATTPCTATTGTTTSRCSTSRTCATARLLRGHVVPLEELART